MHKEELQDLLLFCSSHEKTMVTLKEYADRMKDDQKYIYYACGESADKIERMPQTELVRDKGYEILYLTDDVDEFALKALHAYAEKEFKSVSGGDLGFEPEEKLEETEQQKDLFAFMADALKEKVKTVRASHRLKTHPVCLTSEGEVSLEMEKVLDSMPGNAGIKAERVLEINESHPIFEKLTRLYAEDQETLKEYSELLYDQAALMEGLPVEDPVAFAEKVCRLMAQGNA